MLLNSYQLEQLENIRRTAERGVKIGAGQNAQLFDTCLHILDLYQAIKKGGSPKTSSPKGTKL